LITIELPGEVNSVELGRYLEGRNCFISYNSGYLVKKNWIQTFITRNTTIGEIQRFILIFSTLGQLKQVDL
jgi:hypothetical protein